MTMSKFDVRIDDLSGREIQALIEEHMAGMLDSSPPESVHALPIEKLRQPDITFWSVWHGTDLCGCGALKELDAEHGEIKAMRTRAAFLRQGVGKTVLEKIIREARARGYRRLSLETGSPPAFAAARAMYASHGFETCGPFGDYAPDPYSVFMTKIL